MSVRLFKHKLKIMLEKEEEFEFPQFIHDVRKCLGACRRVVCEDTGIKEKKLRDIELGVFCTAPLDAIAKLCQYYGLPKALMTRKAKEYVAINAVVKSNKYLVLRNYALRDSRDTDSSMSTKIFCEAREDDCI